MRAVHLMWFLLSYHFKRQLLYTGCCYLNFMSISSYVQEYIHKYKNSHFNAALGLWEFIYIHFSPLIKQSIRRTNTFMRLNVNTLHNFLPYCHNFHHQRNRQIIKGKSLPPHTHTHKMRCLGI